MTEDGQVGSMAIRMHEWPGEQANLHLHPNKLFLHMFVLGLRTEQDLNVLQTL